MNLDAVAKAIEHRLDFVSEWQEVPPQPPDLRAFKASARGWAFLLTNTEVTAKYDKAIFVLTGPAADKAYRRACDRDDK